VWQEPYYYSAVIAPTKSSIRKLQDLKGKRIAFVDEKSSSGYLYPQVALQKLGIKDSDFKETFFSGNHQASIQFLEAGKVDAAAVYSDDEKGKHGAWAQFAKDPKKYRIVWISEPIPSDPFCVRQDFYDQYPKVTHTLMFALIDLFQENRSKQTYSEILGSRDLMPATSKQYDPVREMVKALKMELKP
jgi:phosphonate transport system substrate-binding protein